MAFQYCRITPETTWGTFNAAGTGIWIRQDQDNAMMVRAKPIQKAIRSADALNRRIQMIAPKIGIAGGLQTLCYPSQAGLLLAWAAGIGTGDLTSATIDYFDGTQPLRYLGCKVDTMKLSSNNDEDVSRLNFTLTGQQISTPDASFVLANAVFPSELPYVFQESAGYVSIGGTRTKYQSLELSISNKLSKKFDESRYLTTCKWRGRDVDAMINSQYVAATDRTNFTNVTAVVASVEFYRNATNNLSLNLESTNYYADVDDSLPLDNVGYQKLSLQSFWDPTALTDLTGSVVYNGGTAVTF